MSKYKKMLFMGYFTYFIFSLPILIPLKFYISYIGLNFFYYLIIISTMALVNIFVFSIVYRVISQAIRTSLYKFTLNRVFFQGFVPVYGIFILSLFVTQLYTDSEETMAWLLLFWGYAIGFVLSIVRLFIVNYIYKKITYDKGFIVN